MRKSIFLGFIAFATLTMTGCSNDESIEALPQENAINFGTYLGRDAQTRAAEVTTATLPTDGFGVFAWLHQANPQPATFNANFMKNVEVSTAQWTYSPLKYWPNDTNNQLDFVAYAPHSNGSENNISFADGQLDAGKLTFTVNDAVASQTDLVVATPQTNMTYNSTNLDANKKVPLTFSHLLSRITFYAKTADNYPGVTITINKLTMTGSFSKSGTVDLTATTPAITAATATSDVSYVLEEGNGKNFSGLLSTDLKALNTEYRNYLMIIPTNAHNATLKVEYTVAYNDGSTSVSNVFTTDVSQAFEAGKAYKFSLSVGLKTIEFTASVTTWGNENDIAVSPTVQ